MARNRQLARSLRVLLRLVASRSGVRLNTLAREEGVHERTIRRDLEALQAAGFPLVRVVYDEHPDRETKYWRCDPHCWPALKRAAARTVKVSGRSAECARHVDEQTSKNA
jgi:DeoR/GlpR family transcriptional regulator of sugar metabolism